MKPGEFRGIEGLRGREPVGAILSAGTKDGKRFVHKDMFFIKSNAKQKEEASKPEHPAFARYHALKPEHRRVLYGNLVHSREEEIWTYKRSMYRFPKDTFQNPLKGFACEGDGREAIRWDARLGEFVKHTPCGDLCEFAQSRDCKPDMKFLFRLRWPRDTSGEWAVPLTKLISHGWKTTANFLGFFEYVRNFKRQLRLDHLGFFGLPFMLELVQEPGKDNFPVPVIKISPDGDLLQFFQMQAQSVQQLGAATAIASLTDDSERDPDVIESDFRSIELGKDYEPRTDAADIMRGKAQ